MSQLQDRDAGSSSPRRDDDGSISDDDVKQSDEYEGNQDQEQVLDRHQSIPPLGSQSQQEQQEAAPVPQAGDEQKRARRATILWTNEQHETFYNAVTTHGRSFKKLAVVGKTSAEIRFYYYKQIRKLKSFLQEYAIDLITFREEERALQCYWELRKKLMRYDTKPLADKTLIKPDEKLSTRFGRQLRDLYKDGQTTIKTPKKSICIKAPNKIIEHDDDMDPRVMPSYPTLADDIGKRFWKEALSRDSLHSFIVEEQGILKAVFDKLLTQSKISSMIESKIATLSRKFCKPLIVPEVEQTQEAVTAGADLIRKRKKMSKEGELAPSSSFSGAVGVAIQDGPSSQSRQSAAKLTRQSSIVAETKTGRVVGAQYVHNPKLQAQAPIHMPPHGYDMYMGQYPYPYGYSQHPNGAPYYPYMPHHNMYPPMLPNGMPAYYPPPQFYHPTMASGATQGSSSGQPMPYPPYADINSAPVTAREVDDDNDEEDATEALNSQNCLEQPQQEASGAETMSEGRPDVENEPSDQETEPQSAMDSDNVSRIESQAAKITMMLYPRTIEISKMIEDVGLNPSIKLAVPGTKRLNCLLKFFRKKWVSLQFEESEFSRIRLFPRGHSGDAAVASNGWGCDDDTVTISAIYQMVGANELLELEYSLFDDDAADDGAGAAGATDWVYDEALASAINSGDDYYGGNESEEHLREGSPSFSDVMRADLQNVGALGLTPDKSSPRQATTSHPLVPSVMVNALSPMGRVSTHHDASPPMLSGSPPMRSSPFSHVVQDFQATRVTIAPRPILPKPSPLPDVTNRPNSTSSLNAPRADVSSASEPSRHSTSLSNTTQRPRPAKVVKSTEKSKKAKRASEPQLLKGNILSDLGNLHPHTLPSAATSASMLPAPSKAAQENHQQQSTVELFHTLQSDPHFMNGGESQWNLANFGEQSCDPFAMGENTLMQNIRALPDVENSQSMFASAPTDQSKSRKLNFEGFGKSFFS